MSLLGPKLDQVNLGMSNNSDNAAVGYNPLRLPLNILWGFRILLGVLGECFLLAFVPVLVEAPEKGAIFTP